MGEQVGGGLPGDELLVSIVITHALNHKAKNKPFLKWALQVPRSNPPPPNILLQPWHQAFCVHLYSGKSSYINLVEAFVSKKPHHSFSNKATRLGI